MLKQLAPLFITLMTFSVINEALCQVSDSTTFRINSRYSFYSNEKDGEILLHVPTSFIGKYLEIKLIIESDTVYSWKGSLLRRFMRLSFPITLTPSVYTAEAELFTGPAQSKKYSAKTNLIILKYKPNEVKTDRLTGGLIVNKRQFFPFGFYTYSPVFSTLPEEEVVKGFNMISPYQKILPESLDERKAYMDRCAQLGMKVHYNLLSVSGGGGVGSKIEGISDEEKRIRLIEEIKTFMDHPALLAWYISDEPTGNKISPEQLEEIYKTVKAIDPWHPVSIVFMTPFLDSKRYANALDIVMADPYPVPDVPVSMVGNVTWQLKDEFEGKRPVWIVPQVFGGGEWWRREPTIQEVRSMTYQAIINGATGIQYFVRQGLNYFPKSPATWSECGRMATEIAELTPWLLSEEKAPEARSFSKNIIIASRVHEDKIVLLVVNRKNEPARAEIWIEGGFNGKAKVLFENRIISVNDGLIYDQLPAFGTQVYLIDLKPGKKENSTSVKNLITDAGFEDLSSPGLPVSSYARPGGDRGATYFTDTREHFSGSHSLRMITPQNDKSLTIRLFPFPVTAGSSYMVSLWAKSDPEQRRARNDNQNTSESALEILNQQWVEISVGEFSRARFTPDDKWRKYVTFVTIPVDTLPTFKTNLLLKMPGEGVAWFDDIEVIEDVFRKR
jgi:hypothetical protein